MKYFKNKSVLITGHTGFKGSWLSIWLSHMGANVVGVSIDEPAIPSNFFSPVTKNVVDDYRLDIRDTESIRRLIEKVKYIQIIRGTYRNKSRSRRSRRIFYSQRLFSLRRQDQQNISSVGS